MEEAVESAVISLRGNSELRVVSVAKPPWTVKPKKGKLERLIVQLGEGKGRFSETEGIPRSIGCIGNNRFILRREPMSVEKIQEVLREFAKMGGKELWLTNYDSLEQLLMVASYAVELGIPEVYAVALLEDVKKASPVEGVKFVAEVDYYRDNIKELEVFDWLHGALVMIRGKDLYELFGMNISFEGEVYVDVLFPGSYRKLDFNVVELRRVFSPNPEKYSPCLADTLAVTADGYVLPCPLLREFVLGDLKTGKLRHVIRRKAVNDFWTLTKDRIGTCSKCPFKYICHDCRALEFQATGDLGGVEYCPIVF